MFGTMMDRPLLISSLLWRAEHVFGDRSIVTFEGGEVTREMTYRDLVHTARGLSGALAELGVVAGTRVGSLAWNSDRHLAAYFAVPGMGAVLHTINHRMPAEHIAYTIEAAEDEVLLVDADLLPTIVGLAGRIPRVKHVVVMGDAPDTEVGVPYVWSFDDIVRSATALPNFPDLDELTAASICFTSGTTGLPKGVVYTHRSTVLHALATCAAGGVAVSGDRSYLLATQMSHVHSWGVPYAGTLQGSRLLLPGPHPSPANFLHIASEHAAEVFVGSPTVAAMMRDEYRDNPKQYDLGSLDTMWLGGQAPPEALVEWWASHGASTVNGWGMTETSPMGTFCNGHLTQGTPLPLFEIRVVAPDGSDLPWDGKATGELEVRSPWVTASYLSEAGVPRPLRNGWLRTGDVALIHRDGQLQIRDRIKDLIKSGGEWISSIELENHLMLHPHVTEAAVIARPDEIWQERPVAWVSLSSDVQDEELRAHVASVFPRYWVPDVFVRVDAIPKTSVGKIDKAGIRAAQDDPPV